MAGRRQRRLAPWPASLCSEEAIGNEIRGAGSKRIDWRSSWRASCSQSMACGLRRNRLGGYGPLSRMLHVNIRGSFGDGGFRGGLGLIFLRAIEPIRLQPLLSLRERGSLPTIHLKSTASLTVGLHIIWTCKVSDDTRPSSCTQPCLQHKSIRLSTESRTIYLICILNKTKTFFSKIKAELVFRRPLVEKEYHCNGSNHPERHPDITMITQRLLKTQ